MRKLAGLLVVLAAASSVKAGVVLELWSAGDRGPHPKAVKVAGEDGKGAITVDLKDLAGAKVLKARLLVAREPVTGEQEEARTAVVIRKSGGEALKLLPPWYDSFDATDLVKASAGRSLELAVESFPKWLPDRTELEVLYEGSSAAKPPQGKLDVQALHRSGQTFITFKELDNPFADGKPVTLGALRTARDELDSNRPVRYLIYRHTAPIDEKTLPQAEWLGEVEPFSGFNLRGVSLDRLIYQHQLRAIDDALFARSIAPGPFGGYSPDMPQMAEVVVDRLCVEDGKPLPPGTGLYVHQPDKPGKAWYAVVAVVDGAGVLPASGAATAQAVNEQPGTPVPVFQGVENLKVFYDYPGERRRYVQWCAPPLANLPNQYFNYGLYVPPGGLKPAAEGPERLALAIYFHDWQKLYLRPRWPHSQDMITLSPHDHPVATFGYGYHEALGTLRPFTEGSVHDYTARRIDAFVEWAITAFPVDPARLSTHGMGTLSGTAALHYGLRHPERISLIVAGTYDPDPKSNGPSYKVDNYPVRKTHLSALEAVWGKKDWDLKTDKGVSVWKDRDLVEFVRNNPGVNLPFLSLGSGSMHPTWPQENALLKALMQTRQPFWTGFTWGGEAPRFAPLHLRRDKVYLALGASEEALVKTPWYNDARWQKAALGYWGGGEINTGYSWRVDDVVDTPDRLEVSGSGGGDVTIRNARNFRLKPGEKVRWQVKTGQRDEPSGVAEADANGLVTIKGISLRGRLVVVREGAATAPAAPGPAGK